MTSILCTLGFHTNQRSQGRVGFCMRDDCTDLKRTAIDGLWWVRYVEQPPQNGVWVIFYYDLSAIAVFSADDELGARRSADENQMHVAFCEYGTDIRELLR